MTENSSRFKPYTAGDYRMLEIIGGGSFGVVYRATHLPTGEFRAVKRFYHHALGDGSSGADSLRRDCILLGLDHPHIVKAYEPFSCTDEHTGELTHYLPMELLDGWDMDSYLAICGGQVQLKEVLRIFDQCADALSYAASRNVVHRDIKPSNVFLCRDRRTKILDFGVGRINTDHAKSSTGMGIPGQLDYVAPDFVLLRKEHFRGDEVSDIFSFGVCLFHCLIGKRPFPDFADDYTQRMVDYTSWALGYFEREIDYSHEQFAIHPALVQFFDRCLAHDRNGRFASFKELRGALAQIAQALTDSTPHAGAAAVLQRRLGSYRLLRRLSAEGAFARIWLAERDGEPGQLYVIKVLRQAIASPENVHRFWREADILQQLRPCEYIVDFVEKFEAENEYQELERCIVLEYLSGKNFSELLVDSPSGLPAASVLSWLLCVARALSYAHGLGYVHRDVKPENIIALDDSRAKVLDFGVALVVEGSRLSMGNIQGSWDYIAPECAYLRDSAGRPFAGDARSDIYSLGVCAYKMLTGVLPYPALSGSIQEVLFDFIQRAATLDAAAVDWSHETFKARPELARLIRSCLEREREKRPAAVADIVVVLDELVAAESLPRFSGWRTLAAREGGQILATQDFGSSGTVVLTRIEVAAQALLARRYCEVAQGSAGILIAPVVLTAELTGDDWYGLDANLVAAQKGDLCAKLSALASPLQADQLLALIECLFMAVGRLHDAGIAHGGIDTTCVVFSADGMKIHPPAAVALLGDSSEAIVADCRRLVGLMLTGLLPNEAARVFMQRMENTAISASTSRFFTPPQVTGRNALAELPELARIITRLHAGAITCQEAASGVQALRHHLRRDEKSSQASWLRLRQMHRRVLGANRLDEHGQPADFDLGIAPLDKRYEVLGVANRGGCGIVLKAVRLHDGWPVAIKYPSRDSLRFNKEIYLTEALRGHPGIVRYEDFFQEIESYQGDEIPFLVIEWLDGRSLTAVRWAGGHVELLQILGYFKGIAEALQHCHDHGVTHRDVKPGNLFVTVDGTAKLLDFGIARTERGTRTAGGIPGTYEYMAPETGFPGGFGMTAEQVRRDPRIDVFGLGVTFYRVLHDSMPYDNDPESDTSASARFERYFRRCEYLARLRTARWFQVGDVLRDYPEVVVLLEQLLAPDPHRRLASMNVVIDRISFVEQAISSRYQVREEAVSHDVDSTHETITAGDAATGATVGAAPAELPPTGATVGAAPADLFPPTGATVGAAPAELPPTGATVGAAPADLLPTGATVGAAPADLFPPTGATVGAAPADLLPAGAVPEVTVAGRHAPVPAGAFRRKTPFRRRVYAVAVLLFMLFTGTASSWLYYRYTCYMAPIRTAGTPEELGQSWELLQTRLKPMPPVLAVKVRDMGARRLVDRYMSLLGQELQTPAACRDARAVIGRVAKDSVGAIDADTYEKFQRALVRQELDAIVALAEQQTLDELLHEANDSLKSLAGLQETAASAEIRRYVVEKIQGVVMTKIGRAGEVHERLTARCSSPIVDWPKWARDVCDDMTLLESLAAGRWPSEWERVSGELLPPAPAPDSQAAGLIRDNVVVIEERLTKLREETIANVVHLQSGYPSALRDAMSALAILAGCPAVQVKADEERSALRQVLDDTAREQLQAVVGAWREHQWSNVANPEFIASLFEYVQDVQSKRSYDAYSERYKRIDACRDTWIKAVAALGQWDAAAIAIALTELKVLNADSAPALIMQDILADMRGMTAMGTYADHAEHLAKVMALAEKLRGVPDTGVAVEQFIVRCATLHEKLGVLVEQEGALPDSALVDVYSRAYPLLKERVSNDVVRRLEELRGALAGPAWIEAVEALPELPAECVNQHGRQIDEVRQRLAGRFKEAVHTPPTVESRRVVLDRLAGVLAVHAQLFSAAAQEECRGLLDTEKTNMLIVLPSFDATKWSFMHGEQNHAPASSLRVAGNSAGGPLRFEWKRLTPGSTHVQSVDLPFVAGGAQVLAAPTEPPTVTAAWAFADDLPFSELAAASVQVRLGDSWRELRGAVLEGGAEYAVRAHCAGFEPWAGQVSINAAMAREDPRYTISIPLLAPVPRLLSWQWADDTPVATLPKPTVELRVSGGDWAAFVDGQSSVVPGVAFVLRVALGDAYDVFESEPQSLRPSAAKHVVRVPAPSPLTCLSWQWADWVREAANDVALPALRVELRDAQGVVTLVPESGAGDAVAPHQAVYRRSGSYTATFTATYGSETPQVWTRDGILISRGQAVCELLAELPPPPSVVGKINDAARLVDEYVLKELVVFAGLDVDASLQIGQRVERVGAWPVAAVAVKWPKQWLEATLGGPRSRWVNIWSSGPRSREDLRAQLESLRGQAAADKGVQPELMRMISLACWALADRAAGKALPRELAGYAPAERFWVYRNFDPNPLGVSTSAFKTWRQTLRDLRNSNGNFWLMSSSDDKLIDYVNNILK